MTHFEKKTKKLPFKKPQMLVHMIQQYNQSYDTFMFISIEHIWIGMTFKINQLKQDNDKRNLISIQMKR